MSAKQTPTDRVLRELLERLANAREMADVVIAAGIAIEDLDAAK